MVTLSQIEQRIANLQKKAEDLRKKKSASVILSIKRMMDQHGLTVEDLEASLSVQPARTRATTSASDAKKMKNGVPKGKLPPKYRDPKTGATWSGHARPPAWIKSAKDRSMFLIDSARD